MRIPLLLLLVGCAHAQPSPAALAARAHRLMLEARWDQALGELGPAIADAERRGDAVAEATLRVAEGRVVFEAENQRAGRGDRALPTLEKARALAAGARADLVRAAAIDRIGMVAYYRHFSGPAAERPAHLAESRRLFEEARALREAAGAPRRALAESHFHLGLVDQMAERFAPSRAHFDRCLALAEADGDAEMQSYALRHLGYLDELDGLLERSEARFARSLELRRSIGWRAGTVTATWQMAHLALERRGDVAAARRLAGEALLLADEIGARGYATRIRADLARHDDLDGQLEAARSRLEAIRGDAATVNDRDLVAEIEERLGLIAVEQGDLARAADCFARAAATDAPDAPRQRARVDAVRRGAASEDDPALFARFALSRRDAAALARARALAEAAKDAVLVVKLARATRG